MNQPGTFAAQLTDFRMFLWRDALLLLVTLLLWWLTLRSAATATALSVATGIATGLCALQWHEWAHVLGALRAGAPIYPAQRWWHPFLFGIDHARCTREQFVGLSWPAFAATAIYLALFLLLLPRDTLTGQVALAIGVTASALTVLIEVPLAWRVAGGGPVPDLKLVQRPQPRDSARRQGTNQRVPR